MDRKNGFKRRLRSRRGSTTVESVLVIIFVTLVFWYIFLIFDLCMIKVVSDHASFVMARSHIVGFHKEITDRAMNVGMIPISGNLKFKAPGVSGQYSQFAWEVSRIPEYLQENNISGMGEQQLDYQFWSQNSGSGDAVIESLDYPQMDSEQVVEFGTKFNIRFSKDDYGTGRNEYWKNTLDADYRHRGLDTGWVDIDYKHREGRKNYWSGSQPDRHRISLIPGIWAFVNKKGAEHVLTIEGKAEMLNHAAYYLDN